MGSKGSTEYRARQRQGDLLPELATQVEQGAVYDRHLIAIAAVLEDALRAIQRRSQPFTGGLVAPVLGVTQG